VKSYPSLAQLLADERADPAAGESYLPRDVTVKAICYLAQLGEQWVLNMYFFVQHILKMKNVDLQGTFSGLEKIF
jgi:hypothetical protein